LQRQAFGQIARADAGGVEGVDDGQHRFHARQRHAQPRRHIEQAGAQIAAFVDLIDQLRCDRHIRRAQGQPGLRHQMIGQADARRGDIVDAGAVLAAAAASTAGAQPAVARAAAVGDAVLLVAFGGVIQVHARFGSIAPGGSRAADQRVGTGALLGCRGCRRRAALARGAGRFEERIALDFLGDEPLDLQVRQRQQLDRLLQLRRHHQRLGLAQVEAGGQAHGIRARSSRPDTGGGRWRRRPVRRGCR
jgi:hypothetical protein